MPAAVMIFKRKDSFFLDLSKAGSKPPEPKAPEPKSPEPKAAEARPQPAQAAPQPAGAEAAAAAAAATAASAPAPAAQPVVTTAEAIAAELRAAQEALPPPSTATFAPECLNPANAVPTPRRRAGANLGVFKGMVDEMFRS